MPLKFVMLGLSISCLPAWIFGRRCLLMVNSSLFFPNVFRQLRRTSPRTATTSMSPSDSSTGRGLGEEASKVSESTFLRYLDRRNHESWCNRTAAQSTDKKRKGSLSSVVMASELVKLSLSLGALGLRKLTVHEEAVEILKFGLSFICPDSILVTFQPRN